MIRVFKALSCDARLSIVHLLMNRRMCVNAIASKIGSSQSSVSQHLRVLRDSGMVTDHRCGYHIHYTVNREILEQIADEFSRVLSTGYQETECPGKEMPCAQIKNAAAANQPN